MSTTTLPPTTTAAASTPVRAGLLPPAGTLRLEGALLAAVAVIVYAQQDASWWQFAALLMLPDLGMLGFVRGPRVGALTYNLTHTLAVPLALAGTALLVDRSGLLHLAVIWVAHIGADRAMGYGLKYPTRFTDTHLQRLVDTGPGQ